MTDVVESPVSAAVVGPAPSGHVIVCGLRGIGLRIVEQLYRSGEQVVVLGEYADRAQLDVVTGWGVQAIAAQGSSAATLTVAGIQRARAVVCVVEQELANLEIALVARELRSDVRVVAQLGNQAIGRAVADGNGPGGVLDVAELATPGIVEACLSRRVHEVQIDAETFLIARVPIDRPSTLRAVFGDLAPVAVQRPAPGDAGATVIDCPGRDFQVQPGDVAVMLGTAADLAVVVNAAIVGLGCAAVHVRSVSRVVAVASVMAVLRARPRTSPVRTSTSTSTSTG